MKSILRSAWRAIFPAHEPAAECLLIIAAVTLLTLCLIFGPVNP